MKATTSFASAVWVYGAHPPSCGRPFILVLVTIAEQKQNDVAAVFCSSMHLCLEMIAFNAGTKR